MLAGEEGGATPVERSLKKSERVARHAHEVVGLYGDPYSTWGIALDCGLTAPIDAAAAAERLQMLVQRYPQLGSAPEIVTVPAERWEGERARLGSVPFPNGGALLRVAVRADGRRLLVVAHHGACDGLGLAAAAAALVAAPLVSGATGMADARGHGGFLSRSLRRLVEALVSPPPRFRGSGEPGAEGEHLLSHSLPRTSIGTASLCSGIARIYARSAKISSTRLPLMLVGVSARPDRSPVPDRQTRFLRLRVDARWELEEARRALWASVPEPAFPETSAHGLGPLVVRLLRGRLGGTALVSNLGVLECGAFEDTALFPATSGPQAVAVGCSSTATSTTLTVRTRRSEFSEAETRALLESFVAELAGPDAVSTQ